MNIFLGWKLIALPWVRLKLPSKSLLMYSDYTTANYGQHSNHGTFYYNQLAALKILVNDPTGAKNVTDTYFSTLYLAQIEANGEQVRLPHFYETFT